MPLSRPLTSRSTGVLKTAQMWRRVRTVIGRPASICCQCRVDSIRSLFHLDRSEGAFLHLFGGVHENLDAHIGLNVRLRVLGQFTQETCSKF